MIRKLVSGLMASVVAVGSVAGEAKAQVAYQSDAARQIQLEDAAFIQMYDQMMEKGGYGFIDGNESTINYGRSICNLLDAGGTYNDVWQVYLENFGDRDPEMRPLTDHSIRMVVGSAITTICPQHTAIIREYRL